MFLIFIKVKQINTRGSRRRAHHLLRPHQLFYLFKKKAKKKVKKRDLYILRILCECQQEGENQHDIKIKLKNLFGNDMGISDSDKITIDICHRINSSGKRESTRSRDIVARFPYLCDKNIVIGSAKELKGREPPIFVNEQFPQDIERKRRTLRPLLKLAYDIPGCKANLSRDKIIIKGRAYSTDTVNQIPFDTSAPSTRTTETSIMFSGLLSPLSNFHPCTFNVEGTTYTCGEQYYQRHKALFAGDNIAAFDIMTSNDPVNMKRVGNKLNIDDNKWAKHAESVMITGLQAKFDQCKKARDALLATENMNIVECNMYDTFWSCGEALKDYRTLDDDPEKWKGKNKLGKILQSIRDNL